MATAPRRIRNTLFKEMAKHYGGRWVRYDRVYTGRDIKYNKITGLGAVSTSRPTIHNAPKQFGFSVDPETGAVSLMLDEVPNVHTRFKWGDTWQERRTQALQTRNLDLLEDRLKVEDDKRVISAIKRIIKEETEV